MTCPALLLSRYIYSHSTGFGRGCGSAEVSTLPSRSNLQAGPLQLPPLRRLALSQAGHRCSKAMRRLVERVRIGRYSTRTQLALFEAEYWQNYKLTLRTAMLQCSATLMGN